MTSTSCDANDDFPDNGRTGFFNVPSGTYTLRMSQAPDGFAPADDTSVTIDPGLGSTTDVTVTIVSLDEGSDLPEATEEPEDAGEPTEEPEVPAREPGGVTGIRIDVSQFDQSGGPICVELNTTSAIGMRNPPAACDNGEGDADDTPGIILIEDVPPGEYAFFVRSGPEEATGTAWPNIVIQDGQITDLVLSPAGLSPEFPTEEPTSEPTEEPTAEPTVEPTEEPEPGAIEVEVEDANGDPIEVEGTCLTVVGLTDSICDNQEGDQDERSRRPAD